MAVNKVGACCLLVGKLCDKLMECRIEVSGNCPERAQPFANRFQMFECWNVAEENFYCLLAAMNYCLKGRELLLGLKV